MPAAVCVASSRGFILVQLRCFLSPPLCVQHDTVQIASDGGRVCRPLIICDKGVPRVKDEHLKVGPQQLHLSEARWEAPAIATTTGR